MLFRCLAFSLLGLLALQNAAGSCIFSKLNFAIREGHKQMSLTARDPIHCSREACGCPSDTCVVSFHASSGRCRVRTAPSLLVTAVAKLLPWINDSLPWLAQPSDWDSFITFPQPKALWPLDRVHRGRNLGSLGQQFDLNVENVTWTDTGPLGRNADNFARLGDKTKISVMAHRCGRKLLDLSKPFTITVWVKTDDRRAAMPIIETYRKNGALFFHFWFYFSANQDQLYVNGPRISQTKIDESDRLKWRHLACKHRGESNFSFYRNGNEWPIDFNTEIFKQIHEIEVMYVGLRTSKDQHFYGSMACLMIFDKALTADEIKSVRSLCG